MKTNIQGNYVHFYIDQTYDGKRLNDFFDFYHISKKMRHKLRMEKKIQLNHQTIQHDPVLHKQDLLSIECMMEEECDFIAQDISFNILYEDELLLILGKPAGIIIHPDDKNGLNTLANGVSAYYQATHQKHAVRHIHRLDKDTSGCILFCKQPFFQPFLDHELSVKNIQREYLAIAEGSLEKSMTIHKALGKDRHVSNKYRISPQGNDAITHVTPLSHAHGTTLIRCVLETGRTHQIRVHCASIHHPLIGDELYGRKSPLIKRCALHSSSITLTHPLTLKKIHVTCPLPKDMSCLYNLNKLEQNKNRR